MNQEIIMLTKKGLKELRKRTTWLEREHNRLIRELHDIEKGHSREKIIELADINARLDVNRIELQNANSILRHAKLLPHHANPRYVQLGCTIEIKDNDGSLLQYQIVDPHEANPLQGRISYLSPLGRAMLGRRINDIVAQTFGKRFHAYQHIKIK